MPFWAVSTRETVRSGSRPGSRPEDRGRFGPIAVATAVGTRRLWAFWPAVVAPRRPRSFWSHRGRGRRPATSCFLSMFNFRLGRPGRQLGACHRETQPVRSRDRGHDPDRTVSLGETDLNGTPVASARHLYLAETGPSPVSGRDRGRHRSRDTDRTVFLGETALNGTPVAPAGNH